MSTQPEQILEDNLVRQLGTLGYTFVAIKDEAGLLSNLKAQLERHNQVTLSAGEFNQVLNHLDKGNVFDRAKILRDKMSLRRENGETVYLEFFNTEHWCRNEYQVTQQVTVEGRYKNRYDVTLLINGLPLVQIELKRRGLELKEAFHQVNRYQRHSFWASHGLFQYVQFFVISNGVNTKYFANNKDQSFKQTFFWADEHNRNITQLEQFALAFLEKCHLSKMIAKYTVLHEGDKVLMVMRPYQYNAVEAILDRVQNSTKNGYIWHTTGSGKTLTSFKAAQILTKMPQVHKVVFVVDRRDLDYQTSKEFNEFSKGSVDSTEDTSILVKQLSDQTPLIVTTIQKLNNAIQNKRYQERMERLKTERMVFIFDECHRSQFGDTHQRIKAFFQNHQMFGFTGTPIFADNASAAASGKQTTKDLFHDCLHRYVITDAIGDENVLKFSVEYVGRYKEKTDSRTEIDIQVEDIDTKELLESPVRLEKIVDYILANHDRKTHNKDFSAMFCVSSIDTLIQYYELFKQKKERGEHDLRVVTVFSYTANAEDKDADGLASDADVAIDENAPVNKHAREKLDEYIGDYNAMFQSKHSTKDGQAFYNYAQDIAKRMKARDKKTFQEQDRVDILLVVNMFLTGFDVKKLNTLYVDKNLKYHGLIQAFSRTNRILGETKSQGNIICFRNLKKNTDDAIALFSNLDAKEVILIEPYEEYVRKFNKAFAELLHIAPTIKSVDDLPSETEELAFVQKFREMLRLKNVLQSFSDFDFEDLAMGEQKFEDYKSKYLDLHDKVKHNNQKEKVSILQDLDFELELIHRDEINVAYILRLLGKLNETPDSAEKEKQRKNIMDLLVGEAQLRSKRELIEQFIAENLPGIPEEEDLEAAFTDFWDVEKQKALAALCMEEQLVPEKIEEIIENFLFTERRPLTDEIVAALKTKPKILEKKSISERVMEKVMGFVESFYDGMGGV